MKHYIRHFLYLAILLAATPALISCGGGAGASATVREPAPQAQMALVRSQVATLQSQLDELQEATPSAELQPDTIAELKDAIEALKTMVDTLLGLADISREELQALRIPIDELENSLSRLELRARTPHGLHQGTENVVYADAEPDTLQTLLEDSTNQFSPLSATLHRGLGDPQSSAPADDFRIKSIASDGANGFHIVYLVGDVERTVHFRETDFDTPGCLDCYTKADEDGGTYWLLENNSGVLEFRYLFPGRFSYLNNDANLRNYMTFGSRTSTENLPMGVATYVGYMDSDTYVIDDPGQRGRIRGSVNLTTNFNAGTMEGKIRNLRTWSSSDNAYLDMPETTRFEIRNATLADGRILADVVGADSDVNAINSASVRGYEGTILGEFYGPGGEEFGGVVSAASAEHNRVLAGTLRSRRLNPRIPEGVLSVLSAAIDRDYPESATTLSDSSSLASIRSDGASGMYLTYMIDGSDHRIHLEGSDFGADPRYPTMYFGSTRNREHYLWDYTGGAFVDSPEFEHFNVSGWTVAEFEGADRDTPSFVARGPAVYGVATAELPAGTARYDGRTYASSEPTDHADHLRRSTMQGNISLVADFDASTISGTIDDIEVRAAGASEFAMTDGQIMVDGGMIADSRFEADLSGTHGQAGFEGEMVGRFYGPAASEVGGTLTGTSTSSGSVVYGWFGATKE